MRFFMSCFVLLLFLTACQTQSKPENDDWVVSSLFKSDSFTMIGKEGKLGFIYDDSEVVKFYPNQTQKYMWHFWGESRELQGKLLKVMGTSKDSGKQIKVFEAAALAEPLNGADAHHPSNMTLPSTGLWRLDAYVGDEFYGNVVVKVNEAQ